MSTKIRAVCVGFLFLLGAGLVAYPTVSDWVNTQHQSGVAAGYQQAVGSLEKIECEKALEAARIHNEKLAEAGDLAEAVYLEKQDHLKEYTELLNPDGSGVLGIIRIPKLKMESPIYHTTSKNVLQKAVGHYVGSSLPVGGSSTHSILSGHTGLPSAKLFTDIDQLETGDVFYVEVLEETFAYEVDQIKVVLPKQVEDVNIEKGKDYVTLVTCTPYGINSHRLLVRGHRTAYVPEEEVISKTVGRTDKRRDSLILFAIVVFVFAALTGSLCGRYRMKKLKSKKRLKKRSERNRRKKILLSVLMLMLLLSTEMSAEAAGESGTLTIHLQNKEADVELAVYHVADYEEIIATEQNRIKNASEIQKAVEFYEKQVAAQKILPIYRNHTKEGTLQLGKMPTGLYLVMQISHPEDRLYVQNFLVSVPCREKWDDGEEDRLLYDVEVYPKEEEMISVPENPGKPDPPVKTGDALGREVVVYSGICILAGIFVYERKKFKD